MSDLLKDNQHFVRLHLEKNEITNVGAKELGEMLQFNTALVHIDICGNNIGPDGFESLFYGLTKNHSVFSLNLGSKDGLNRNRLGERGAAALQVYLSSTLSLQFLDI